MYWLTLILFLSPVISTGNSITNESSIITKYWFDRVSAMQQPMTYPIFENNVDFIRRGLGERINDKQLGSDSITVSVKNEALNVLSVESTELKKSAIPEQEKFELLPGDSFDEGWTKPIISRLYLTFSTENMIPIKPEVLESDVSKAFEIYFFSKSQYIILRKESCGSSGDEIFYVQFYPTNIDDRVERGRPWNGYHFYATRFSKQNEICIAAIPLPDYPYKYIKTGQRDEGGRIWDAKILSSSLQGNHL